MSQDGDRKAPGKSFSSASKHYLFVRQPLNSNGISYFVLVVSAANSIYSTYPSMIFSRAATKVAFCGLGSSIGRRQVVPAAVGIFGISETFLTSTNHMPFRSISSTPQLQMSKDADLVRGFESICLHSGYLPDETTSRGVPLYRTAPYVFESSDKAAKLFALEELGNIYTRIMNPTTDVLEQRFAAMEGGAAALALSSGTAAAFNTIINVCEQGDNFVSARNLYGGTYTQVCCSLYVF